MKITAVIVARRGSRRVLNKMHRRIGGETLVERKIRQLLGVSAINEVLVGTDDTTIRDAVISSGAKFLERKGEFCDEVSKTPNDMVIDVCSKIDCDLVVWAHPTNPFIESDHYQEALDLYLASNVKDSVFCATKAQGHLWFQGRPLNFDPMLPIHQVARELDNVYWMNGGIFIRSHRDMMTDGKFLGSRPLMYVVDEITGWDIDDEWEMRLAQMIWENKLEGGQT